MALDFPIHGGDLAAAEARWGRPAAGWLDLSTGINPWPYPLPPLPPAAWTRLPGRETTEALCRAAAAAYGAPAPDCVLPAPGSGALIRLLPALVPSGEVAILGPTYGEHETAWRAAGHRVRVIAGLDEAADAPVVVLANPNNPDGRLIPPDILAEHDRRLLVVDEAFGDTLPEASLAPRLPARTVVLRSFGKFYGLAGLRLGFALARPELLAPLAAALGPWAVSGPALEVGRVALVDAAWAAATRSRLAEAATALDRVLTAGGLTVIGGTPLFRLARHPDAHAVWERLGVAGILVRAFPAAADRLRVGLPPDAAGLERLAQALKRQTAA